MMWIVDGRPHMPTQEEIYRSSEEKEIRGKINMANRRYRTRVTMIAEGICRQNVNADIDDFVDQIIKFRENRDKEVGKLEKELGEYLEGK